MKLHSCLEGLDLNNVINEVKCLEDIQDNFTFIKVLGSGKYGTVIKVNSKYKSDIDTPREIAIKIAPVNEYSKRAIYVACQMNDLNDVTPIFVKTFGWITCNTPLEDSKWGNI